MDWQALLPARFRRRRTAGSGSWSGSPDDLEPRLVWLVGSPRSGSTWLMSLMGAADRVVTIDEPGIGMHLGLTVGGLVSLRARDVPWERMRMWDVRVDADDYFFNDRHAAAWRAPLRDLLLARLQAQVADVCRVRGIADPVVVVKEPHGSQAADLLMSLLPEAHLLFLLRDGRDVLDSELDAGAVGSWASSLTEGFVTADEDRHAFLRDRAHLWALRTTVVQRAYERHAAGRRMRVRYEDLLADTPAGLAELDRWLGLGLGDRVEAVAEAGRVDRQPEDVRGPGRFVRSASPGEWRRHLTDEERQMVDHVMGPTLAAVGYT